METFLPLFIPLSCLLINLSPHYTQGMQKFYDLFGRSSVTICYLGLLRMWSLSVNSENYRSIEAHFGKEKSGGRPS